MHWRALKLTRSRGDADSVDYRRSRHFSNKVCILCIHTYISLYLYFTPLHYQRAMKRTMRTHTHVEELNGVATAAVVLGEGSESAGVLQPFAAAGRLCQKELHDGGREELAIRLHEGAGANGFHAARQSCRRQTRAYRGPATFNTQRWSAVYTQKQCACHLCIN